MATYDEWVTPSMFDDALHFAETHPEIPFCDKMSRVFRVRGRLSDKQVLVLLRIKAGKQRYARGL